MTPETLHKANQIAGKLEKWRDIQTRLALGNGFFSMSFKAFETKTLKSSYELQITDKQTLSAYKEFVDGMVNGLQKELEDL